MATNKKSLPVMSLQATIRQFRYEVAREIGLDITLAANEYESAPMHSLHVGAIRGDVAKRMVDLAQEQLGCKRSLS